MKPIATAFCIVVVGLLAMLVMKAGAIEAPVAAPGAVPAETDIDASVSRVNGWLRQHWSDENLEPAERADDLTVYRRLSLALHGTIPSLEEVVAFQADASNDRVERWLLKLVEDPRFSDYFADRLARVLTGVEEGQFVIFRRDRLRAWLGEQLRADVPWQNMTTDLIAGDGLWTSRPATNFITAASIAEEGIDVNVLAGRTSRAFLGQRIDCAQCHDHPFDSWKQQDFEGLAAFFGQARVTPGGVIDRFEEEDEETKEVKAIEYVIVDPGADEGRIVPTKVPFHEEWLPKTGSRRQQLASWVTHPENRRFERAAANRIWGLMFGRAWSDPVDDIAHPADSADNEDFLDVLGQEFRSNGGQLKFLIRLIAQSDVFRMKSEVSWADADLYSRMDEAWAVYPLVRLRPEQMIGAMFQAGHTRTVNHNSNMFVRFTKLFNENDFLKEYGDATDDELLQQSGTIPQALLRLNGQFTREFTKPGAFDAAGQILKFSGEDEVLVQNCFLACLTRLPEPEEREYFVAQLRERSSDAVETAEAEDEEPWSRAQVVQDLYWVLFNSPGFSWNR
jgi:hypothetical protein